MWETVPVGGAQLATRALPVGVAAAHEVPMSSGGLGWVLAAKRGRAAGSPQGRGGAALILLCLAARTPAVPGLPWGWG